MYTYLEDIPQEHITKNTLLKNVIGKIKDIRTDHTQHFTQFTLHNNNTDIEWTCIINNRLYNPQKYPVGTIVLLKGICLIRFEDIGKCLLIQEIKEPAFNLTGNKDDDVFRLLTEVKFIIDTQKFKKEFKDEVTAAYLELRDSYKVANLLGLRKWEDK